MRLARWIGLRVGRIELDARFVDESLADGSAGDLEIDVDVFEFAESIASDSASRMAFGTSLRSGIDSFTFAGFVKS